MQLLTETLRAWEALGLKEGLKAIREAGFDGVDFSFYGGAAPYLCGEDYKEKARETGRLLAEYGLTAPQAHAPFEFCCGMPWQESCREYAMIRRSIEAAGLLGIDHITVHGVATPAPVDSEEQLDYNYRWYKQWEPLAADCGVKLAVENLQAAFTSPALWTEILQRLDSPQFVGLVDVGHCWVRGGLQPGEFIRRLPKGSVKGLHIQDTHNAGADEHLLPYGADVDFDDLCAALAETGYDGDFSFEAVGFLRAYGKRGLIRPALTFTAAVGRKLMADIEEKKRELAEAAGQSRK